MALTAALTEGLDRYAIGTKLRELRRRKRMGLAELGRHTGLSASLLSKIERGKMYPTLPTLLRIALVFSVDLGYFFSPAGSDVAVMRRDARLRFPDRPGETDPSYHFESLDYGATERRLSAYLAEFDSKPIDDVRLHRHDGDEFLFVLSGTLGLYVEDHELVLEAEDSVYFRAGRPHGYRRIGRRRCRAVVVVAP